MESASSAQPAIADAPVAGPTAVCTAAKVRRLARRVTQIYDEALAPHGLTVGQFGLLSSLGRRSAIGVGGLAERLAADASTVSRLLRPLEAAGLVCIETDPDDRRGKAIRLTDAGADRRRAARPGWEAAQDRVAAALGDGRLAALRFIVDDAHAHL
jgi:DNA-binding MarR family transcriptional regulator